MKNTKKKYRVTALIGLSAVLLLASNVGASPLKSSSLEGKLQTCSLETTDSHRLACFDSLAQAIGVSNTENNNKIGALPEGLGGGKFDKSKVKSEGSRGQVSSCKKSHDGRWFFIFEEGQIWKQSNKDRRRYNYKDCNFSALIRKDGFGYIMYIEELSKEVRVKRHQ